ncbi:MAG TPA: PKD domain-containing protein [Gemmatimonadaceae bacterium]|nr:PKD domain-containing protein [Gemmatimonadaceae bacterium]
MPHRSPVLPRTAFTVILAIALAGCAEDDVTAPERSVAPPSGPSLGITYVNGNVTMTDLGTLPGGNFSEALSINDLGMIVGRSSTTDHPSFVGSAWPSYGATIVSHADPTQCPTVATGSDLRAINNTGTIVGHAQCSGFVEVAFVRDPAGVVRQLPGLNDGHATVMALNDQGLAVGQVEVGWTGSQETRAGIWDFSGPTITVANLGDPPGGLFSIALAINNAGTVVGRMGPLPSGSQDHAFVRPAGGQIIDIGTLPGDVRSWAYGISESGVVVGFSSNASNQSRPFTWTASGGMQPLGTIAGLAIAVHDNGIVVGQSGGRAFAMKAGVMVDLGVLPGYALSIAYDVNAAGEIVGESSNFSGARRAVRWLVSFPAGTPPGSNVNVQPIDETTGEPAPVQITFDNVTGGGETTVTSGTIGGGGGPPAPNGFRLGNPPTYYDVETTATFSGSVTLCFGYSGVSYGYENNLRLLHHENGAWTDVTTSLDTVNDVICGSVTSLSPFLVAEENAAPVVTAIALPAAPVPVGTSVSVTASFTDANPGDAHTASITWDDGATSALSVTESVGAGNASGSHTYRVPGVYTIQVSVTDGDLSDTRSSSEDQPAYIVVYSPTSGFVTGGGWIDSPVGACLWSGCAADGTSIGKVTFGFVSRYKKGASTPTGNTEFQLKAGGLAFRSTSYQWLVVAGARAQYKGEGEIVGSAGSYGFLITAIDGALQGGGELVRSSSREYETPKRLSRRVDRFRIKIWETVGGAIVYDNKMGQAEDSGEATALGGGSIVIHKRRGPR